MMLSLAMDAALTAIASVDAEAAIAEKATITLVAAFVILLDAEAVRATTVVIASPTMAAFMDTTATRPIRLTIHRCT